MYLGMVSPRPEPWLVSAAKCLVDRLRVLLTELKQTWSRQIDPRVKEAPLERLLRHERRASFYRR